MIVEKEMKSEQYSNKIISERNIYSNIFFQKLKTDMTLEEFRRTQEQFYYAVLFFARPMTALVAKFPRPEMRLSILENVVEEHGSFRKNAFHETTFREFLTSIGSDISRLEDLPLRPEVRAFNSTLMTACIFDEVQVGVACMGVIEYMFAEISAIIGNAVVERGWCSAQNLVHYKLHSAIDKQHARDFFEIIEDDWQDEDKAYLNRQGIEMGVYIFDRLYKDLYSFAVS